MIDKIPNRYNIRGFYSNPKNYLGIPRKLCNFLEAPSQEIEPVISISIFNKDTQTILKEDKASSVYLHEKYSVKNLLQVNVKG